MKREMGKLASLALALGCSGAAFGGPIYKCEAGGNIHFQNQPCADAAQRSGGRMDDKPSIYIGKHNSAGGALESRTPLLGGNTQDQPRRVIMIAAPVYLVDACLDEYRPLLRNAEDAHAVGGQLQAVRNEARPDLPEWTEVVVDGRASAGAGNYFPQIFYCVLADDGGIDRERTSLYRTRLR